MPSLGDSSRVPKSRIAIGQRFFTADSGIARNSAVGMNLPILIAETIVVCSRYFHRKEIAHLGLCWVRVASKPFSGQRTEQVKTGQVNPDRPLVGPSVDTFVGGFVGSP